MDSGQGWTAGLGAAIGVVLYAGAELARRILGSAPKNDPVLRQLRKDMAGMKKQMDRMAKIHHSLDDRVRAIELNGSKNDNG